jgi:hypothetical protein
MQVLHFNTDTTVFSKSVTLSVNMNKEIIPFYIRTCKYK